MEQEGLDAALGRTLDRVQESTLVRHLQDDDVLVLDVELAASSDARVPHLRQLVGQGDVGADEDVDVPRLNR